ncbi:MAG: formyltransferase family protein [Planctomycetota bacterium]
MDGDRPKVAVAVSGSGRTLENLIARTHDGSLSAEIVLVIGSKPCRGVEIAQEAGIAAVVERGVIPARNLLSLLEDARAEWLVLAGYLKLVDIPAPYEGRVVNIHPALLPDFGGAGMYGTRVHEAVLEAVRRGEIDRTGCTVHLCDGEFDRGQVVHQASCPVLPNDTAADIAARVFDLELKAYPAALRQLFATERAVGRKAE